MVADSYKGLCDKGLASVKFCDSFLHKLVSQLAENYKQAVHGYICMLIAIQICRVTIKSNA